MIAHGQTDQLMQRVDEAFQAYVPRFSFTIAEGTHQDGPVGATPPLCCPDAKSSTYI